MAAPLAGITVVDVSQNVAGPYAGQILGDLGASVVKVEPLRRGDDARHYGPPFWDGESCMFLSLNRNKRSIALDLKTDAGRRIVLDLCSRADVFVENYRPGVVERLGLGYDDLAGLNPALIYCSISGFGRTGPLRDLACNEPMAEAYGGYMSLTGEEDGPPVRSGASINDMGSGMWAALGVVAALVARAASGRGQRVDTSLFETQAAWLPYQLISYFATGEVLRRMGSGFPTVSPYQLFPTQDGHVLISAMNDKLWAALCPAIGLNELLDDPRFRTNPDRVRHRRELVPILSAHLVHRPTAHWVEVIRAAGVPCSPVRDLAEVAADPQLAAREMLVDLPHPSIGTVRLVAPPVKLSDTPLEVRQAPPLQGEHTAEILAELGYDAAAQRALREQGAI
ncbi:MAG: CoA transferase [Chloroflexi bacterium]|nr:CoA transferase [Chloroflexota bacterium]